MKADVASTVAPQAAHARAEAIPKLPQAAHPIIPIVPGVAARPPLADALIRAAPTQDFNLARDLALFSRVRAEGGRRVVAIFVVSTAVTIANMFGQVRLNEWNGQFFDAVGRRDLSGFVHDLWTFLIIIAVLLALTVAQTFLGTSEVSAARMDHPSPPGRVAQAIARLSAELCRPVWS
jgi:putative ATP-binding cassette transporter